MTAPRPVFEGCFLFLTRRCTQRQFLLRPDAETNNAYTYLLAEAARRFDIQVVLSQMMSNHSHTVLWDPEGRHVEFRQHFHRLMAKSQNALRGRWENMWSSEEPCIVELVTLEDLLDKLVYTAANPVLDGLVERVHHWPGPKFLHALLSGTPMRAHRPRHFFREEGPMPSEIELICKLPEAFPNAQEFLDELRRRVAAVEDNEIRARQQHGRRVLGRRVVLRQSWRDSPSSREPRRGLRPRVACRSRWAREATLCRNKIWMAEYREMRSRWLAGEDVEFPYGTYWLRKFGSVCVASRPESLHLHPMAAMRVPPTPLG